MACIKAISAVLGCAIIFFAFGLYFSSGSVSIYLISYLRLRTKSNARHEHRWDHIFKLIFFFKVLKSFLNTVYGFSPQSVWVLYYYH